MYGLEKCLMQRDTRHRNELLTMIELATSLGSTVIPRRDVDVNTDYNKMWDFSR